MKKEATIFDYARMCKDMKECKDCPLGVHKTRTGMACGNLIREIPDKTNEIILNWCKEHPAQTRQDRFLKMFPNVALSDKIIKICPEDIDIKSGINCGAQSCVICRKNYWLAEVEENE